MVYSSYPISIYDFPCYSVLNPFNKAIEHGPFRDDLSIYPLNWTSCCFFHSYVKRYQRLQKVTGPGVRSKSSPPWVPGSLPERDGDIIRSCWAECLPHPISATSFKKPSGTKGTTITRGFEHRETTTTTHNYIKTWISRVLVRCESFECAAARIHRECNYSINGPFTSIFHIATFVYQRVYAPMLTNIGNYINLTLDATHKPEGCSNFIPFLSLKIGNPKGPIAIIGDMWPWSSRDSARDLVLRSADQDGSWDTTAV